MIEINIGAVRCVTQRNATPSRVNAGSQSLQTVIRYCMYSLRRTYVCPDLSATVQRTKGQHNHSYLVGEYLVRGYVYL